MRPNIGQTVAARRGDTWMVGVVIDSWDPGADGHVELKVKWEPLLEGRVTIEPLAEVIFVENGGGA